MEDPSPLVRSNAAISIAQFSKDTAVAVLSEAQFDPDASVQEVVAHALARLEP
jgi:HEAT repeat protein